jgi:BirA family transcriptional regulator, biotin operon repressor / biotin---[acetyl-CoA-carboxylase] ligase
LREIKMLDLVRLQRDTFLRRVEWHESLASTNDRALQLAAAAECETPHLIAAGEQTAGRGRGNNRWWSGRGALTFSVLLDPEGLGLRPELWPRVSLTAGVAICQMLEQAAPHESVGLKWPNDIWLNGKKVCGILVETTPNRRLILGIGLNVNNSMQAAPEEIRMRAASLCDVLHAPPDPTDLLVDLLQRVEFHLQQLAVEHADLPRLWQTRCVLTGRRVEIDQPDRRHSGRCLGIDTDGALLLDSPAAPVRLHAGVVASIQ